ncbi:hypothetical protein M3Y97_00631300 [Aphelenchoides bicaudatus]|nr:hypothetical protein M3Y97_00631300 [Aphelenchoides bicaudatus]
MRFFLLLALVSCFFVYSAWALGKLQSVAVNGTLMCKKKPYANVKVKLYEVDFADPDDLLMEGRSLKNGTFYLEGFEEEIGQIAPKVNIYHNCEDEKRECLRLIEISVPADHIFDGKKAKKVFDIGVLNLEAFYPGESRDCHN